MKILTLLLLLTPIVFANPCVHVMIEEKITYSCTLPIALSIVTPEFIELHEEHIIASAHDQIEIHFSIYNSLNSSESFQYYLYAYTGSRCVSCEKSREETLTETTIPGKKQETYSITIAIPEAGNFSYKVFARRNGETRWQEKRGSITIQNAPPEFNPFFQTKQAARKKYIGFGLAGGAIIFALASTLKKKKSTTF
jgi:hypothetical protein